MANFIERLKNKLKIKKLNPEQPLRPWIFVIFLNIVAFGGYFYLKINNIQTGA